MPIVRADRHRIGGGFAGDPAQIDRRRRRDDRDGRTSDSATAADVRFAADGLFAYEAGSTRAKSAVRWRLGTWYRSTIVVDTSTTRSRGR
jgi:hypothetical protein